MNATHPNALELMRLARRAIPGVQRRPRAPGFSALGSGVGARAARFAAGVLGRYAVLPGRASPERLVYPAQPSVQPGTLRRVLHEHRHQVSLALRLSPALLRWPGMQAAGARNAGGQAAEAGATARPPRPAQQAFGPPQILLRLAGADPGFDAEGLPSRRVRTAVGRHSAGEPGEELSPVEVARVVREQGSLVLAAANADLVQPLVRRAERIPLVAGTSAPHTVGPASGAAPVVPRVVHRPAPAPVEPDDDMPVRGSTKGSDAHGVVWAGDAQATLDPAHLHRLADQVVRVIDDRMLATRERMGRI